MARSLHRAGIAALIAALAMLALPAGAEALKAFQSPSKNIGCYISSKGVRCDIDEHSWSPPPRPKSCPSFVEWGYGLMLHKHGKGRFVCAGDTARGAGRVLRYGHSIKRGRFKCKSKRSGMRCVNKRNHHGFKLSREKARRF